MPLHGKVVVLKRSGGDGTEFPLTASCLFGRKPDCDIRIQLPQVSKEHCRIDLNENKEVILTNLSSVNPTQVNGQALQQSERLKHGDIITVIDRSFRFEYPPPPTPKKRSSVGGKAETAAVYPHLKDGTNIDNIQRCLEKTQEVESKEENKNASPFSDLYQMIKQSLDVKTPRKSSISVLQTPSSRFCTPKPQSARKSGPRPLEKAKGTPKNANPLTSVNEAQAGDATVPSTPKVVKNRRSVQLATEQEAKPAATSSPRRSATPQSCTVTEAIERKSQTQRSPSRRKSKEITSPVSGEKQVGSPAKVEETSKATPKSSENAKGKSRKRKSGELAADLPTQLMKRKRVSFGTQLSPELFDKRLPPNSPLRKGATPRRSLSLYRPKESLLRRASVIGLLKERINLKVKSPAKMKTPSPKKSIGVKSVSPKTPTSAKKSPASPKTQSPAQRAQSPKSKSPSPGKKSTTPKKASPKAQSPKLQSPKSKSPSPAKVATPKKASPKMPSPKSVKTTPAKSPVRSKPETPKDKPLCKSSSSEGTPKRKSAGPVGTPVKTPLPSADQTPKVQGRFSVSRINTPSPVAEDALVESVPSAMVTPKLSLRKKSLKSSTKKTPVLKCAAKMMRRKSGMRASMKVMTSWADIVRFGKAKVQVAVPSKSQVAKKTTKKTVPKPQTPKRRLVDHVSTGHAASPATIVVGRAHRLRVAYPTGAPPKIVTNTAVLRKNLIMDEDLTGISDMFKTPKNEKRQSAKIARHTTRTPLADVNKSRMEPSVLHTPEETGEMVVSPIGVTSTIKGRRYNSEAVQRLLDDETQSESTERNTEVKVNTPRTPKQKPQIPEGLTGVKRMMKTPKQKAEPLEDLRGKLLKTPRQKSEQQECLSAIKRIMKTPKEKVEPIEDAEEKLVKTPTQTMKEQERCLTGVKQIQKTLKEKAQPVEDLLGKLSNTPEQKMEKPECFSAVKMITKTPDQKVEQPESISGVRSLMRTPTRKIEQQSFLTGVKRIMKTPKQKAQPVEKNFGLKRLMRSPQLRGNAPVEDFEGLKELMKEPVEEQTFENTEETIEHPECTSEQPAVDQMEVDKVISTEEMLVDQQERTSISSAADTKMLSAVPETKPVREDAPETKPVQEDAPETKPVQEDAPETKPVQEDAPETKPVQEDAPETKPVQEDAPETKPVQEDAPETKSVCGRRMKTPEPKQEDDPNPSDETIDAPVKTKRGRKVECLAPRQAARDRTVKFSKEKVSEEPEEKVQESTVEPRMTRLAKEPPQQQTEETTSTEPEQSSHTAVQVEQSEALEEPVVKPKRGRKTKAADPCEVTVIAQETNEKMPIDQQQDESTERPTKSARGRRAKVMETEAVKEAILAEAEGAKDEEVSVPVVVRGRQGKKTEAPAVPAVKQRRGRAGKGNDDTEANKDVSEEMQQMPEIVAEQTNNQKCVSEPTEEMVHEKPKRGRKKKASVEQGPEMIAVVSELPVVESKPAQFEQSVPNEKPRRRAKTQAEPPQPDAKSAVEEASPSVVDETVEHSQVQHPVPTQKPTRGRKLKSAAEPSETETKIAVVEREPVRETQPEQSVPAEKPKRGRKARPAEISAAEPSETETKNAVVERESVCETQPEQSVPAEKPKRGRKARSAETSAAEPSETETKNAVVEREPVCETQPEQSVPAEKPKRGRKARHAETSAAEPSETETKNAVVEREPVCETQPEQSVPAEKPKRGRKARPAETSAAEPSETETKNAVVEREPVCETQPEQSVPAEKPKRGRKARSAETSAAEPSETETKNAVVEREPVCETQPEQSVPAEKPKRGRKARSAETSAAEPSETETKNAVVEREPVCETQPEQSVPAEKPKRGRKARPAETSVQGKQEHTAELEKGDNASVPEQQPSQMTFPEPKGMRRTRKGEEPSDEVQTTETMEEAPVVEQVKPEPSAPKSRRGALKPKKAESITLETAEEVLTDKPTRGRKGKEDIRAAEVNITEKAPEDDSAPAKPTRERTAVSAVPAKRARRGAAVPPEESAAQATAEVSEAVPVEHVKRGRKALKTSACVEESKNQDNSTVEPNNDTEEKIKSVKWKAKFEVIQVTPLKMVRGKRAKSTLQNLDENVTNSEEQDLSGNIQPTKRARRGKAADVVAESTKPTVDITEAESQPKTRKGRGAKK